MPDLTTHPFALHVGGEVIGYYSSIRCAEHSGPDAAMFKPNSTVRRLSPLPWWVIDVRNGACVAGHKPHGAVLAS